MERERGWVDEEDEAAEAAEELAGGLEVRQRERMRDQTAGREVKSVYFDGDNGEWKCRHCMWTYQLSGPGIDHIQKHEDYCLVVMDVETLTQLGTYFHSPIKGIQSTDEIARMKEVDDFIDEKNKSLVNGEGDSETKGFDNQENVHFHEEIQKSKNMRLENGSKSNLSSEGCSENGITHELEIKESAQVKLVEKSKLEVAEIDVERVLEEQDTHDLYCPNCHSCITKRVILRKRKRTVRETQYDAPPAKIQEVQHGLDVTIASAEITELDHDREPDIFRCLSCFSFFIPTESGFNIFRLFGKKEVTDTLQTSRQIPAKPNKWIPSIFKPVTSINKETGSEFMSPDVSDVTHGEKLVSSLQNKQSSFVTTTSGAESDGKSQTTIGKNDADSMPWESFINDGEQVGDPAKNILESYQNKTNFEGMKLGQSQTTTGNNDTEVCLPQEPNGSSVEKMEVPSQSDKQNTFAQSILGATIDENLQTNIGEKLDNLIHNNDAGIMLPSESMSKEMEDATYIYQYSATTTSISGVIVHEGQTDIGHNLNDVLKRNHAGETIVQPVSMVKPTSTEKNSKISQNSQDSVPPAAVVSAHETQIYVGEAGRRNDWDVLKCIVYGGLIESVTSLGVVSSAAGSDASTLNIVALGLANLIGGLFVIAHDLSELRSLQEETTDTNGEPVGRYWDVLGRKVNFRLHATVAVLTYIVVGLLPPIIYGFSFRKSDNKEYKLIAVAAASLLCIALLAIGKAHVKPQKRYISTLVYYLSIGLSASGLSYVAGVLIHKLLHQLGLFDNNAAAPAPPSIIYRDINSMLEAWASS